MAVTPTTHLEKSIAGTVEPVTHLEKVISEYGGGGGGGGAVDVDIALSLYSTNPVQNKVIAQALQGKANTPLEITCTMTSETGGTWSGATWNELQAACDSGRAVLAMIAGIGQMAVMLQPSNQTTVVTDPLILPSNAIGVVAFQSSGTFAVFEAVKSNPTVVTVSGTTPTISAADNTIYECGELTSLTVSGAPASGAFSIVFTSGATATTTSFPATILGLEDFAAEANTIYEINVLDSRAVVGSWAVSVT